MTTHRQASHDDATTPMVRNGVNANDVVDAHDILFVTLDTLRWDVAERGFRENRTPNLRSYLGSSGWERRHSPASFTYAAHAAFFAGFLPTPADGGRHTRRFALRFDGSETTGDDTCVLEGANIVEGLHTRGYHTACIGGVGFFNKRNPLGSSLPSLFAESHWDPDMGVTSRSSFDAQIDCAEAIVERLAPQQRLFLFVNVAALHQPNKHYVPGALDDSPDTQLAALEYVDTALPRLVRAMRRRGPFFAIFTSDHGTAYGDDGYHGHRLAHPVVWTVPYADGFFVTQDER